MAARLALPVQRGVAGLSVACALVACTSFTPTSAPPSTVPAVPPTRAYPHPRLDPPGYGMQVFLWWTIEGKTADNDAKLVYEAGFGWLKQKFAWRDLELAPGEYNWQRADWIVEMAERYDLNLLIRLDQQPYWVTPPGIDPALNSPPANLADFGTYCGAVAQRYVGRIAAYEVWNEPNLSREWGGQPPDPAGYVDLLKVCYTAIKAADPAAIVISAGLAPTGTDDPAVAMPDIAFYEGMYQAGAAPFFDMLGVHAPGWMNPPERSPDDTEADPALQVRWITFRQVEDVRALMVRHGDADKQIAITEMGWTTDPRPDSPYHWLAVSPEQQADYLVRAYRYARQNWPWVGFLVTIFVADPAWTENDEQYWWSITRPVPPGDPPLTLPAYHALQAMEK